MMNHIQTSSNELPVDARPMFASTWVALFMGLRKNYTERRPAEPVCPESLKAVRENQRGEK